MAQPAKKKVVSKDSFTPDGVRMFNPTKEHGIVYYDAAVGECPTRFIQEYDGREVHYAANGTPVGYEPGKPLPQPVDVVEAENTALKARIRELEESQKRTEAMIQRLLDAQAATAAAAPLPAEARTSGAPKGK